MFSLHINTNVTVVRKAQILSSMSQTCFDAPGLLLIRKPSDLVWLVVAENFETEGAKIPRPNLSNQLHKNHK